MNDKARQRIIALINDLQIELDSAAQRRDLTEFEYNAAYHAALFIDSLVNPEEWAHEEPLEDIQIALAALAAMRE
jgi:hypothetical protein